MGRVSAFEPPPQLRFNPDFYCRLSIQAISPHYFERIYEVYRNLRPQMLTEGPAIYLDFPNPVDSHDLGVLFREVQKIHPHIRGATSRDPMGFVRGLNNFPAPPRLEDILLQGTRDFKDITPEEIAKVMRDLDAGDGVTSGQIHEYIRDQCSEPVSYHRMWKFLHKHGRRGFFRKSGERNQSRWHVSGPGGI